jgi:hypothetical protein
MHAGIAMPRAVQIVHAEVASRVRTMIINACAARRAGNTPEEMNQLLRCVVLPQSRLPPMHLPLLLVQTMSEGPPVRVLGRCCCLCVL